MLQTRVRVGPTSGLLLSALFALLFTFVGSVELFFPQLAPRYGVETPVALRLPYSARLIREGSGDLYEVSFEHRRITVPRGTLLDPRVEDHRATLKWDEARRPPTILQLTGSFVLNLFLWLILTSYFGRFGHSRLKLLRSQAGLLALMVLALLVAKALITFTSLPVFWIPVSALAFWAALGFDRRTALLVDLAISFMIASLLNFDLMLLTVFVVRGVVASLLFVNKKEPRQALTAGLASGIAGAVAYVALVVVLEGGANVLHELIPDLGSEVWACIGGGAAGGLLANILREPALFMLGQVSRSKLLNLTDIELPLLRKMQSEAPGSWEHSRAMANLAEVAASAIGADSLLTRVGAYYHDLGKTVQPEYFIENLPPGTASPHSDLAPEVSADVIIAHVVAGTEILREGGIPEPVVEFAYTHHGSQLVEYFWGKYQQENERRRQQGEEADDLVEGNFRYPGMAPLSRETAILMLVDAIEAASRTVQPPQRDKFEEMIRRVVFHKLQTGQLDESGLTLVDLRIMTDRMASALVNMYHGRIKYPWQTKESEPGASEEPKPKAAPASESASVRAPESDSEPVPDSESDSEPDPAHEPLAPPDLPAVAESTSPAQAHDDNKEQSHE